MKLILIATLAFLILTPTVFSELTVEDIEKIGSLIKASEDRVKTDLKASEDRVKTDIGEIRSLVKASEDRVKEHVDLKIENVSNKVDEMDKRLNQTWGLVVALIALVVLAVGIPQIIIAWRASDQKSQAAKIEDLQQKIEELQRKIETIAQSNRDTTYDDKGEADKAI